MKEFQRLLDIMKKLRAPGGCPWDREQTIESLKPYLLEETYETLEAMDIGGEALYVYMVNNYFNSFLLS